VLLAGVLVPENIEYNGTIGGSKNLAIETDSIGKEKPLKVFLDLKGLALPQLVGLHEHLLELKSI
jgi:hypothetical protein